ncbi:NADAR family protein [Ideonella sp.]|uniref:NADAR family protein n=1 Tax=Ideonella sp. TaxID=1929293 RepID=UPI0035B0C0E2
MKTLPKNLDELRLRREAGEAFRYLHFWGHRPQKNGQVSASCFSQWFEAPFDLEGYRYATAEHFMMAEKARLFGDEAALAKVLSAPNPGAAKAAGRKVKGFEEAVWLRHRFDIVVRANRAKFQQNEAMASYLCQTGDKVLVEASPVDAIWGIGLAADDERANNPSQWRGLNLLGFALMQVRAELLAA